MGLLHTKVVFRQCFIKLVPVLLQQQSCLQGKIKHPVHSVLPELYRVFDIFNFTERRKLKNRVPQGCLTSLQKRGGVKLKDLNAKPVSHKALIIITPAAV